MKDSSGFQGIPVNKSEGGQTRKVRRCWIPIKVTLSLSHCDTVNDRSKVNKNVLTTYCGFSPTVKIIKIMAIATINT